MGVMGGKSGAREGDDCDSRFNRDGGNMGWVVVGNGREVGI